MTSTLGPSYKIAIPIAALYAIILFAPTIDIAAIDNFNLHFFILPVTITSFYFPLVYPLSDSITEVYGKKVAYNLTIWGYIFAVAFSFLNNLLLSFAANRELYSFLFQTSLALTIIGPVGYIVTTVFNVKLLSKLKVKMRGKHFIFRSLLCSQVSEIIISVIVFPVVFYGYSIKFIALSMLGTSIVKFIFTIPMVLIARGCVAVYRYVDNIYEEPFNKTFLSQKS